MTQEKGAKETCNRWVCVAANHQCRVFSLTAVERPRFHNILLLILSLKLLSLKILSRGDYLGAGRLRRSGPGSSGDLTV